MNQFKIQACVTLLISVGFLTEALSDDWPQWLGPQRDAVWRENGILSQFPEGGPKLRWKAKLGGGYSGPAVAAGRVFVMDRLAADVDPAKAKLLHDGTPPRNINFLRKLLPGQERVVCLNEADGKVLWTHQWNCPYTTVAAYAIGPRATPTVDGNRVYALGAEGNLVCLSVQDGSVLWDRDFKKDYQLKIRGMVSFYKTHCLLLLHRARINGRRIYPFNKGLRIYGGCTTPF